METLTNQPDTPSYDILEGDLIDLALKGHFEVIAHGCNCFNVQRAGIALQMADNFNTNMFPMEQRQLGDYNKLGQIDVQEKLVGPEEPGQVLSVLRVVNCYTQYQPGKDLDYVALAMCLRKINHEYKGMHVGLPMIGAGIAGGDWFIIESIIQEELKDCKVTVVKYNPKF
jgi:O-acetyl-ADP-ribose deacetylase (regulator of RNase III)